MSSQQAPTIPMKPSKSGQSAKFADPALVGGTQGLGSKATSKPWFKPGDIDAAHARAMADDKFRKTGY